MALHQLWIGKLDPLVSHNTSIAAFIRERFAAARSPYGMQTENTLHTLDDEIVGILSTAFLTAAQDILGQKASITKMWGYMQEPGHPYNQNKLMLHQHRADLSFVYYARVPAGVPHPQGTFTFACPELVHVTPFEGMLIAFGPDVIHEAYPTEAPTGLRVSVAVSLDRAR